MSKLRYNADIRLEIVDPDNEFLTKPAGSFHVISLPLENIEKLSQLLTDNAHEVFEPAPTAPGEKL